MTTLAKHRALTPSKRLFKRVQSAPPASAAQTPPAGAYPSTAPSLTPPEVSSALSARTPYAPVRPEYARPGSPEERLSAAEFYFGCKGGAL